MDISIDSSIIQTRKRKKISEVANDIFSSSTGRKFGNVLQKLTNNQEVSFIEEETWYGKKRSKYVLYLLLHWIFPSKFHNFPPNVAQGVRDPIKFQVQVVL